ncbi:PhoH family protein [Erysipelothrix rhusiopathiae]|uniref:PhoH-like protein n=1 Tax=Erysipelothrix rhusiopathiae ATCC 19414 TaxID=525280 RepID=E7FUC3_ERYRH|nr:PhoH family protein [Erysipelothrix rhusiopathiae]EFY09726.1 PhoH family protein [Erysipelothrix rhusiopathiae ATCC 19414]VEH84544.1 PhoH-like protein [Erysipelothrix rhusiopathiae]
MVTQTVNLNELEISLQQLVGIENKNIRHIEKNYEVNIHGRDAYLSIDGSEVNVNNTVTFIRLAASVIKRYERLDVQEFEYLFDVVRLNQTDRFIEMMDEVLTRSFTGKPIRPKTLGQKVFIDAFKQSDLTFAIGPAGTGKTFLAVCYAVELLRKGEIQKIILTRPAVEAGENLGFLPGDLKEKIDPYLRPLYDALDDMLSPERVQRYMDKGVIEIAPLAYMRGRTLDDAMIILDEAQNTTKAQMMMFLSRLGRNSKMIVTGDVDQIDLPRHQASGLRVAQDYLSDVPEIRFVNLSHSDVVRHPLVIKILKKFAEGDRREQENTNYRR